MATLRIWIANDQGSSIEAGLRSLLQKVKAREIGGGESKDEPQATSNTAQRDPDMVVLDVAVPDSDSCVKQENLVGASNQAVQDPLTRREREVVKLVSEGKTTKEVASVLGISVKTAETHRSNIMRKLDFHSVSQLVLYAVRNQIIQLWPSAAMSA